MSDTDRPEARDPPSAQDAPGEDASRRARLAQALRANLARRKAQQRARTADTPGERAGDGDDGGTEGA